MKPTRIILADDDNLVRAGIRALLETFDAVTIVGEAANGQMAWQLCQQLRPDVVFLDINMPKLNGIEAAAKIRADFPRTGIIILSMIGDPLHFQRAMEVGVNGYLLKNSDYRELSQALQAAQQNETYISPSLTAQISHETKNLDVLTALTPRQREILQLIAEGHSTKEIANMLSISAKTVETHRANIMDRLNIFNLPELVVFAIRAGLVIIDDH